MSYRGRPSCLQSPPPLFLNLHCGSGSFQFPPALLTVFRQPETRCSHGMKRKKSQGIYTKNKSCTWPLSSLYKKNKQKQNKNVAYLRPVPLPTFTPRHCYPLEKNNHTEYSTSRFCFTSLELQNERAGMGEEQKEEFTKSTLIRILCGSTKKSEGEQLNCNFFFL